MIFHRYLLVLWPCLAGLVLAGNAVAESPEWVPPCHPPYLKQYDNCRPECGQMPFSENDRTVCKTCWEITDADECESTGKCLMRPTCEGKDLCVPKSSNPGPECGPHTYIGRNPCCPGLVKSCGKLVNGACQNITRPGSYPLIPWEREEEIIAEERAFDLRTPAPDYRVPVNFPQCLACGDGLCTSPEDICNCPADCIMTEEGHLPAYGKLRERPHRRKLHILPKNMEIHERDLLTEILRLVFESMDERGCENFPPDPVTLRGETPRKFGSHLKRKLNDYCRAMARRSVSYCPQHEAESYKPFLNTPPSNVNALANQCRIYLENHDNYLYRSDNANPQWCLDNIKPGVAESHNGVYGCLEDWRRQMFGSRGPTVEQLLNSADPAPFTTAHLEFMTCHQALQATGDASAHHRCLYNVAVKHQNGVVCDFLPDDSSSWSRQSCRRVTGSE